ncbi:MAG: hypothetical protein NXI01_01070 [Gammaproteobacteria bacterium]|nr:hypothetical protein [Gammaproteobacteria bacterium]
MSGFFARKTLAILTTGAANGARIGTATGVTLAAIGNGGMTAASLLPLAGYCALGGATLIIPALILLKASQTDHKMMSTITLGVLKNLFAVGVTAISAGLLGLAIMPMIKTAALISLGVFLLNLLTARVDRLIPQRPMEQRMDCIDDINNSRMLCSI